MLTAPAHFYSPYAYTSAFAKIKILAKASICPSGNGGSWVLPLSGRANNNTSGSFYNLLDKELGVTSGQTAATNIVQLPLAFVRSGWVDINNAYVNVVGQSGSFWSRTSVSATSAYVLGIYPTGVYPSSNYVRRDGFSLRCLYPGSA